MGDKTAQQGLGGTNNDEQSDGNQQSAAANVNAFPTHCWHLTKHLSRRSMSRLFRLKRDHFLSQQSYQWLP